MVVSLPCPHEEKAGPPPPSTDSGADVAETAIEPCAAGSLETILKCREQTCASAVVRDTTPASIAARHYRIVECKEADRSQGNDWFMGVAPGAVWLYRGDPGSLTFLKTLTELGPTAKYYNEAHFSVIRVSEKKSRARSILWLEWVLTEHMCGMPWGGCNSSRATMVTLCLPEAPTTGPTCQDLPLAFSERFIPDAKGYTPWVVQGTFEVTVSDEGVDVTPKSAVGDWTRIRSDQVGHHDL